MLNFKNFKDSGISVDIIAVLEDKDGELVNTIDCSFVNWESVLQDTLLEVNCLFRESAFNVVYKLVKKSGVDGRFSHIMEIKEEGIEILSFISKILNKITSSDKVSIDSQYLLYMLDCYKSREDFVEFLITNLDGVLSFKENDNDAVLESLNQHLRECGEALEEGKVLLPLDEENRRKLEEIFKGLNRLDHFYNESRKKSSESIGSNDLVSLAKGDGTRKVQTSESRREELGGLSTDNFLDPSYVQVGGRRVNFISDYPMSPREFGKDVIESTNEGFTSGKTIKEYLEEFFSTYRIDFDFFKYLVNSVPDPISTAQDREYRDSILDLIREAVLEGLSE